MKISEAEKLACPFIQHMCLATGVAPFNMTEYSHLNINCITDKCMAWETTKTKVIQDNFFKCACGQTSGVYRHDSTCPICGMEYSVIGVGTSLPREDCEGYCRRLR